MKITKDDVDHVAKLSLLSFEEEDKEKFAKELSKIITYMEKIQELDCRDVPPADHVLRKKNVFREDTALYVDIGQEALANAPRREGNYYKVLAVPGMD